MSTVVTDFVQGLNVEAEKDSRAMRMRDSEYRKKCKKNLKNVLRKCDKGPLIKRSMNIEIPFVRGHITREELEGRIAERLKPALKG